ncbi:efflux RND transporter permease subunit [Pseudomarimonas arenosa]|uniref:Efflux RND transporter permease subunit n=1 Tax=Pseudomarimonas arenosa TaxID=2774145 RepID=A0AAW3ZN60_9GAMM|nr:efflux RND transporter permease subunit [Pseudomarimonas arenosa]MBD8526940.1 efflux RND transporter permease subunit [Pseudomarimonas arenosa]
MNIVALSTQRRVTIAMAMVTLVLFGLIALSELKVNLLPDLSFPTLTVRTEYTGAAPTEIENLITEPMEEAVGVVKGLRKLRSISRTGQSDVVLEFAWGTDMNRASLEVRDKLEIVRLPLDVKPPVLLRFNPSTEPVMRWILASKAEGNVSEQAELMRLRRYADEEIKKRLEPVSGVAAVKISGGLEDEVQVLIDDRRLAQLKLSVDQVIQRLAQENVNISGGRIEEGSQRYLVRTVNQFKGLEAMRELLVTTQNGVSIKLRDVANVVQSYKEREAIIRLDGKEAIEVAIYKEGDANTVAVAEEVIKAVERLKRDLPPATELREVENQANFIQAALSEVKKEALLGGMLAILIIFLFLRDGWSTLVIGLSLPVSIIATFFFMGQLGLSLNVMSLAGLALATGMVVDDSIVVLESIAKARERGLGVIEATITGASEVSMAVVASTLTTVAVFFPLVFVEGVAGQLFKDQALTVSIALIISLVAAMTLIPMLSSLKERSPLALDQGDETKKQQLPAWRRAWVFVKLLVMWPLVNQVSDDGLRLGNKIKTPGRWAGFVVTLPVRLFFAVATLIVVGLLWLLPMVVFSGGLGLGGIWRVLKIVIGKPLSWVAGYVMRGFARVERFYADSLPRVLKHPFLVLGSAAVAFGFALSLVLGLGADLIPQFAQDRFEMTAKLSPGTQLRDTDSLVRAIQAKHADDADIDVLYGVSGSGTRLDANPTESGENIAKLTVVLGKNYSRQTEHQVTERLRETMSGYPGVEVKFGRPELFSLSTPLEIELSGPELPALEDAARRLTEMMNSNSAFADVKSTVEEGYPEIQIRFDQERAAALGLTTRQIADQVVKKVRGEVATRYSFRDRKIDVLVRAKESSRSSVSDIRKLIINPQSERPITLDAVAEVVETMGASEIHRADQSQVALVRSNLRGVDLGTAIEMINEMVAENPLGAGVYMHFGGQGEELKSSIDSLVFALGLAIFLVYLVMASQFESLLHPFVIMFTVPLALVGAAVALWASNSPISVVVFIGLILLVGIVVKNAIVLIDKVNQLRMEGVAKRDAIIGGAESRLRPIVMTTLTTLFGFLPLALMGGEGAEVKSPMAITVIGGLAVSTLLTLIVIPVVYDLLDRRGDEVYRERGRLRKRVFDAERGVSGTEAEVV